MAAAVDAVAAGFTAATFVPLPSLARSLIAKFNPSQNHITRARIALCVNAGAAGNKRY